MTLPPRWKVKRELWRIRDQIERRISTTIFDPPRQYLYDLAAPHLVQTRNGQLRLSERVAIFVLFQPHGIADSTLFTLDHLSQHQWSPLVVSNSRLSEKDAQEVLQRASVLIERPNVGYDFGAYREGIRYLQDGGHSLDRLILMNDSTWFPLREGDTTLDRMEAADADMIGHIYKVEDSARRWNDHVESHLLMFAKKAYESSTFRGFWSGYVMTNSRDMTIKYGEKGITQAALKSGWSVCGLLSREWLVEVLNNLEDDALRQIMMDVVHHRRDAEAFCNELISSNGVEWRERFIEWVDQELSHSLQPLLSATFVSPAMVYGGMGFLKKSQDQRFHLARIKVLNLEENKRIAPLHPSVRQEVEHAVIGWKPPFDWRRSPNTSIESAIQDMP